MPSEDSWGDACAGKPVDIAEKASIPMAVKPGRRISIIY
jgi:hypothetical protein